MSPNELQQWLLKHADSISSFMDYEVFIEEPDSLTEGLGMWLDNDAWNDDGHQFVSLGADGTGSIFALWVRPSKEQLPVVFFGSEGSRGVLVADHTQWVKAIAHAPGVDEDYDGNETRLDTEANYMTAEGDPEDLAAAKAALESYRTAVKANFGEIESLEVLTAGTNELSESFGAWVDSKVQG